MPVVCDDICRMRPLLGTFVEVAASGAAPATMEAAVEAAFAAIAKIHGLMSFHEETSDVSRLNCEAARAAIRVHPWTFQVLEAALEMWRRSNGLFDIRIAPALQRFGLLPSHVGDTGLAETSLTNEKSIELLDDERVRFRDTGTRIDLGGIAKGFAVDRAMDVMRDFEIPSALVNAGGNIAAFGPQEFMVAVRDPNCPSRTLCHVQLRSEALASSGARFDPVECVSVEGSAIINPANGEPVCAIAGATVRAPSCLIADALTKVVMIAGFASAPVLRQYGASALFVSAQGEIYTTVEWNDGAVLTA